MAAPIKFTTASRHKAKAAILITGLSGRGKSGLALMLAKGLTNNWEKVYAVDTENKSLDLFVGLTLSNGDKVEPFKVCNLNNDTGYKPSIYKMCRDMAIKDGGEVIINDSTTHMWQCKNGILDMVNSAKQTVKDSYAVWGLPEISNEKNMIIDLMRSSDIHVINTVRVKEKMLYGTSDDGKTVLEKAGELPIMMPEISYEPDLVLDMVKAGTKTDAPIAKVEKSRYAIFEPGQTYVFTDSIIQQLRNYLNEGADPEVLLEQQRQDYLVEIKRYLDEHDSAKNIWKLLKDQAGYKDTKLEELPLQAVRMLYGQLIAD